ncbi:MAG: carboxymethylenebutenolidase [Pseudonocardiaceae bacterium]|nr:carboxymethylenebutenolidase [Pseudonocardiaceae bacterium]
MAQILTETISLPDGDELRVSFAEPDGVVRGGLVVLHESRGLTEAVRLMVAALADEGWLAVAPHIFRDDTELDHEQARELLGRLHGDTVLSDTEVAIDWLADRGIKHDVTGLIGFDLGGAVALLVAARRPVGAAVSVAGGGIAEPVASGLPALRDVAGQLTCPWLGLYGDQDDVITVAEVEALRDAAGAARVATEVVRFPEADHRFDTDPAAAHEAWQRALNWFDAHLR